MFPSAPNPVSIPAIHLPAAQSSPPYFTVQILLFGTWHRMLAASDTALLLLHHASLAHDSSLIVYATAPPGFPVPLHSTTEAKKAINQATLSVLMHTAEPAPPMNSMKHLSSVICQHASKRLTCACVCVCVCCCCCCIKRTYLSGNCSSWLFDQPLDVPLGYKLCGFHNTPSYSFCNVPSRSIRN